jgi:nitrate reductase cytochrome c-type subunit
MRAAIGTLFVALLGLIVSVGCGSGDRAVFDDVGLVTGQPGMNSYPADEPGETTVLERPYEIAPPLIPHSVDGLVIDRSTNDCLDCHLEGEEVADGHVATAVPVSHFKNDYSGKKTRDGVTGVRYLCTQCHVPQTDAGLLPAHGK